MEFPKAGEILNSLSGTRSVLWPFLPFLHAGFFSVALSV